MKTLSVRSSFWFKSVVAAALSFTLLTPAFQASAAEADSPAAGKTLDAASATAFLDDFFAAETTKPHYVGASVVIVKDGQVLAQKGYGYADQEGKKAVDPASSVFRIASVSKSITASAIMQLVEQGKIGLQDDFTKYVKDLSLNNPFDKPVTIENLLTHTTGFQIQDVKPEDIHNDFEKVVEIDDYVRANVPPVVREPGSSYMYDNYASLVLGLIVENVSGEPYADYIDKHIFEPLGMESSGFLIEGKMKDNLAVGYGPAHNPIEPYALTPTVMPHGGMLSTAEDMSKFMLAFLNGGTSSTGRILSEESVKQMEIYRSSIHELMPNTTYGFEAPFQIPGAGSSSKIITKAGDLNGYSSYLFFIPEQKTGVFLTYNQNGALRNLLYPQFISTFFPQYAAPAKLEAFEEKPDQLAKFAGYYSDLRLNVLKSAVQGEAKLTIHDAILGTRELKQVDENLFVDQLTNQFTAFKLDSDGNALYMKEPYLNPFGYAMKGAAAAGYADIAADHPYARAIHALQSLGYYANKGNENFQPEQAVTRSEFVKNALTLFTVPASKTEPTAFTDLAGHPNAGYVQVAFEIGLVQGNGKGSFKPDQAITRQEAAAILWRMIVGQYEPEVFQSIKLAPGTDEWAADAVRTLIAFQIHGPEVQPQEDGTIDYLSGKTLNRAEEAAILFSLNFSPTDQIYAAMQQQAQAPQSETPPAEAQEAA
ncbi:penicillin-binding protein [Paenibacillus sp. 1011MAR3C5]|uniref:serine hydrolase n=1 Tax=Paenibacillus sp. 1011MAR3C5 TaxID=1675787 RepID=UPI000E6C5E1A|nr:serine hydrolase [Paenibacillus sp. 1011MAR3C5]RJE91319.1 penicillin-binding protein [Paenibacillus sp. 1011MAR3C5]